nr:peptide chain release factor N(5)-glutamine methyltransferase [Rhizomicrobium palustre]
MRAASARLAAAGVDNPRLEARVLWEAARDPAPFESFIARREKREPVAYITGHKEFWSLDFQVGPGVLIPRPDTETMIESVLTEFPDRAAKLRVLDLGTGSGCILAAVLSEYPNATGLGVEASDTARAIATANMERLRLGTRAEIRPGNWAEALDERFDVIVTNPPYISTADIATLEPDVREYEPFGALDGGPDGLDAVRALAPELNRLGGTSFVEIGIGQADSTAEILSAAGLHVLRAAKDLSGISRIVIAQSQPLPKKELE